MKRVRPVFVFLLALIVSLTTAFLCPPVALAFSQNWETLGSDSIASFSPYVVRLSTDSHDRPYTALLDNTGFGTLLTFDGTSWQTVGGGNFVQYGNNSSLDLKLDSHDVPYVAFIESSRPTVKKYVNSAWVSLGTTGISNTGIYISMAFDSHDIPYIAYKMYDSFNPSANDTVSVKKYNGSSWEDVGGAYLPEQGVDSICLAIDKNDVPYVAYRFGSAPTGVCVRKYANDAWQLVGGGALAGYGSYNVDLKIDGNGIPYVSFFNDSSYTCVYKYDGDWQLIGNITQTGNTALGIDKENVPYIAIRDLTDGGAKLKKFTGGSWTNVGDHISSNGIEKPCIAFDTQNQPIVACRDAANGFYPRVYKYQTRYTVDYEKTGNGSITGTSLQTINKGKSGSSVTAVPDEHNHFVKWSDDLTSAARTETNVQSDLTLTAIFAIDTHTVTFDSQHGSAVNSETVDYNTALAKPADPTRAGYTFGGWYPTKECDTTAVSFPYTVTGNVTFYAKWTPITYTVSYDANNGSGTTASSAHTYDVAKALTQNGYARVGYQFAGWATGPSGGVAYANGAAVSNLCSTNGATVALYAVWTPITYTVSYNANGGSGTTAASTHTYDVSKRLAQNGFTMTGYHLAGWAAIPGGSVAYADEATISNLSTTNGDNVTLYAVWTPNTYTVSYNANGGSGTTSASTHTYNVAQSLTQNGFTRGGYHFAGWATSSGGSAAYADGAQVLNLSSAQGGTVNLYAVWGSNQSQKITVQANSTKYGSVTGTGTYLKDSQVTVTAIPKEGYRFVSWTEGKSAVSASAAYTFSVTGDRKLTANFAAIGTPGITVKTVGYNTVLLSFKAVPNASGYEIYRKVGRSGYQLVQTVSGILAFTDENLSSGTSYSYQVRAYCTAGQIITHGKYSSAKSATPKWQTLKMTAVLYGHHTANLKWNAVGQADGYEIWRSTSSKGAFAKAGETSGTSFAQAGLTLGSTYYYKVVPYDTVNGSRVYGTYSSVKSVKPTWPKVSLSVSLKTYHTASLTWKRVAGASGYEVERSVNGKTGFALFADIAATACTDAGIPLNSTYYYRVRPYEIVGQMKVYGGYSAVKSVKPKWPSVTIKSASAGAGGVTLTWRNLPYVSGYEIWRSTARNTGFAMVGESSANAYQDTAVLAGTTYYYEVRPFCIVNGNRVFGPLGRYKAVKIKP